VRLRRELEEKDLLKSFCLNHSLGVVLFTGHLWMPMVEGERAEYFAISLEKTH
jgi:hypothetical protein